MKDILPHTDGGLITAENAAVVFIDHQPQMLFGVANIERIRALGGGIAIQNRMAFCCR